MTYLSNQLPEVLSKMRADRTKQQCLDLKTTEYVTTNVNVVIYLGICPED